MISKKRDIKAQLMKNWLSLHEKILTVAREDTGNTKGQGISNMCTLCIYVH